MASCPRCGSSGIEFDLAADARIYLSFWSCAACGAQGISRLIDRIPPDQEAAPTGPPACRPTLRGHLRGRAPRRQAREGRSRA